MKTISVPSSKARIPLEAKKALSEEIPVCIRHYGEVAGVIITEAQFELVSSLLEFLENGGTVPAEMLIGNSELAFAQELNEDAEMTETEEAQLEQFLAEHYG